MVRIDTLPAGRQPASAAAPVFSTGVTCSVLDRRRHQAVPDDEDRSDRAVAVVTFSSNHPGLRQV
jgi:hypothetical protein